MRAYDIIKKKRDGGELDEAEIRFIVDGFTAGEIPDYQMSAWLMAVYYMGMSAEETVALTKCMTESGDRLDLSGIKGVKADKHSTGGVGDKTSFIVGPLLAALGVPVAKMSGRGLGHTGGTIDKLACIPGFNVELSKEDFVNNVNDIGMAIASQTGNLAPADKKIYALRDVTATVDSIPLIASSIMSKKLASGADIITLDVKCGSGAFMKDYQGALVLAKTMTDIGRMYGKPTHALVTDMDEPLGHMVGNSMELKEAVRVLSLKDVRSAVAGDRGLARLVEVCVKLITIELMLAEKAVKMGIAAVTGDDALETDKIAEYEARVIEAIENGSGLKKLSEVVERQGGDASYIFEPEKLVVAPIKVPVNAWEDGFLTACRADEVGMTNLILGGGRATKESEIDVSVGVEILKCLGEPVKKGEPFAYIYAADESKVDEAVKRLSGAYEISAVNTAEHKLTTPVVKEYI
ncbi:MAG: thymidine phosphorylase [Lachnospiraceae bacterium]|nr:thymidine phosphorylase [Lachnospiraceae bacterium]